jgi:FkbH-like protein
MREIDDVGLLDLDGLQRFAGIESSMDWRKWYLYRQPYTESFWDSIGETAASLIRSRSEPPKKCLVVDCDNTLWGGIIGEDGLGGILLGEDYPGSVFRDFQHQLLGLRSQGVMIVVCSKNNAVDVWEVFDKHDGMALKRDDIIAAKINWKDKPSNILSLAEELNIGLDSFVFVDDNPMEIEYVKSALPMVTCIRVPQDLATFPREFGSYRGFDRVQISSEDRSRSDMMLQERKRRDLAAAVSPEVFRRELQLGVDVFKVRPEHVARATQLINKSNQFNLTTRRKTESELRRLIKDPSATVLAWRVADRFGEYGLVGVAILEHEGDTTNIETLLMSCRVLGRGVERSVFAAICDVVANRGGRRLIGTFLKTNKNQLVENLYPSFGFKQLAVEQYVLEELDSIIWPAEIVRLGL